MTRKTLSHCIVAFVLTVSVASHRPANAGIPVFDAANVAQSIVSAITAISRTIKQIQEYATQLKQYENMLTNTLAPAAYIWDEVTSTVDMLSNTANTIDRYRNQLGSVDAYLSKFKDVNYYRNSPCFQLTGCSAAEWNLIKEANNIGSESQKTANDALFKSIDLQQERIKADAAKLTSLQIQSESAEGQMAALGYANQLASNQTNQLIQIRSLLMAQQTAVAVKMQDDLKNSAIEQAGSELFRSGDPGVSAPKAW